MKNILLAALMALTSISCGAQQKLSDFNFIVETWKIENKETYEAWNWVSDSEYIGESYKIQNGKKTITENLALKVVGNEIIYQATVPNQNEGQTIAFTLNPLVKDKFSFENLKHDFPKKIQYQKLSATKILVNVFGEDDQGFSYTIIKQ